MPERFGSNESTYDALRGQTLGLPVSGGASGANGAYLLLNTTNDPLTGPLDVKTDSADALRVLTAGSAEVFKADTLANLIAGRINEYWVQETAYIVVDSGGTGDYTTIQDALNYISGLAVGVTGTFCVIVRSGSSGFYAESINLAGAPARALNVTLIGEGPVTLNPNLTGSSTAINVGNYATVTFRNISVIPTGNATVQMITCPGGAIFENCTLSPLAGQNLAEHSATYVNCTIGYAGRSYSNRLVGSRGVSSMNQYFYHCVFNGNASPSGLIRSSIGNATYLYHCVVNNGGAGPDLYNENVMKVGRCLYNRTKTSGTITVLNGDIPALTTTDLPATTVTGTGTTDRVAKFTGASTIGDSNLIGAGAGTLTLSAANTHTATFPAAGNDTVAMLGIANTYTVGPQTINTGADAFVGVIIKQNSATQSGNLLEFKNSTSATLLSAFGAAGNLGIGAAPVATSAINSTFTQASGSVSNMFNLTHNTVDGTTLNNTINVTTTYTGSTTITSTQRLLSFVAQINGSGGVTTGDIQGVLVDARINQSSGNVSTVFAYNCALRQQNSGTITGMNGYTVNASHPVAGSGRITNWRGFYVRGIWANTVITNAHGLFLDNMGASSTTNSYGIRVSAQSDSSTINSAITTEGGTLNFTHNADSTLATFTGHTTLAIATPLVKVTRSDAAAGVSAMLGLTALGSGANGDGGSILLSGKSSTTAAQSMGALKWLWVDATHASRKAKLQLTVFDTAERTGLEIAADGVAGITRTLAASEGAYATTAIDLTLTSVHHFVTVTASKTITLPAAATCTGREYIIKAVANNVVIDANASETIDGSLTATLINGECYQIKSDGANWHVI